MIGMILSVMIIGTGLFYVIHDMSARYKNIGLDSAPVMYLSEADINKSQSMYAASEDLQSRIMKQGELSGTDYLDVLFLGGFSALIQTFDSTLTIFSQLLNNITNSLGIPQWIVSAGFYALMITLLLSIVGVILNREI